MFESPFKSYFIKVISALITFKFHDPPLPLDEDASDEAASTGSEVEEVSEIAESGELV